MRQWIILHALARSLGLPSTPKSVSLDTSCDKRMLNPFAITIHTHQKGVSLLTENFSVDSAEYRKRIALNKPLIIVRK